VQVRNARPEEYMAAGALSVRAYVGDGFIQPGSSYASQLADAAHRASEAELYVAVDHAGRLLGAVTFVSADSPYAEVTGPGEAGFRMLAVDPAARGRGVGEALVRTCIGRAAALGCSVLRLSTRPDMAAAHRLYQRLGFYRTPDLDWEPMPGSRLLTYALDLH
jgi:ribosomal protein S18 acetylase RimI-like enzyme